jgi:MFS transporter, DHA1 family, inner membrane transport protein
MPGKDATDTATSPGEPTSRAPASTTPIRSDRTIIAALAMSSFLGTLNNSALNPFLPDVAADLNSSVPVLGQTVTVMFILSAIIGLVAGPMADHFGHRRLLLIGMVALIANAIGTALAPTFWLLFIIRLTGGLAGAILAGVTLAIAGTRFQGEARRRAVSFTAASMASAPILGVPLLTLIGGGYSWRWSFAAFSIVALIGLVLISRALPHDGPIPDERFQTSGVLTAYRPILDHRPTLGLIAGTFMRGLSWTGIITYAGAFFIDDRGLSTGAVGFVYAAGGAGFLVGSLAAGGPLGRFNPVRTVVLATALSGILFGLTFVVPGVVLPVLSMALGGFVGAFGWVAATTLLSNTTPGGAATTMVLNGASINLGSAGGGALGGILLATGGYMAVGLILPLFAIGSSAIIWLSSPASRRSGFEDG